MMKNSKNQTILITTVGWAIALLIFFPIFWMFLTSFKTEEMAISSPPLWIFEPTLQGYRDIMSRVNYLSHMWNSIFIAGGASLLSILISVPAAYAMAFYPTKRTQDILLWMMSTKMMPAVSVLLPVYVIFQKLEIIDNALAMIVIYTLMNLPITIWLIYSYFKDLPTEVMEAGRLDGMTLFQEIRFLVLPMSLPGLASTGLLSIVLCWNEAFWSLNLTTTNAAPLTQLIATFSSPEGLFWAKLSAASVLSVAPIMVLGWFSQKQLVRGLTFGAVK
jgi:sorbitol/mannitol transport system permease protein